MRALSQQIGVFLSAVKSVAQKEVYVDICNIQDGVAFATPSVVIRHDCYERL
jgi:hypothetical protein